MLIDTGSLYTTSSSMPLSRPSLPYSPARSTLAKTSMSGNSLPRSVLAQAPISSKDSSLQSRTASWRLLLLRKPFPQICQASDLETSTSSCVRSVWMLNCLDESLIRLFLTLSSQYLTIKKRSMGCVIDIITMHMALTSEPLPAFDFSAHQNTVLIVETLHETK